MVVANIQLNSHSLTGSIYSHEAFSGPFASSGELRTDRHEIALPAYLTGAEAILEHLCTYSDQMAHHLNAEFGGDCTVINHGCDGVLGDDWSKTLRIRRNVGTAVSVTLQWSRRTNPTHLTLLVSQSSDLEALRMPVLVTVAAVAGLALGAAASIAIAGLIAGAAVGAVANVLMAKTLRHLAGHKFAAASDTLFNRVQQILRPQTSTSPNHYNHAA